MGENSSESVSRSALSVRDMTFAALFAILVGVGANIRIPFPLVPLTLQTFVVFLTGLLLGSRRGALALTLYMALGLLGLPVFAGGGGFHNVLAPSFGFIVGFIPAAWLTGRIAEHRGAAGGERGALTEFCLRTFACLAGMLAYNSIGVLWLYFNLNYILGRGVTFYQTLGIGLFPFLVPDIVKMGVVVTAVSLVANRVKSLDSLKS